MARTISSSFTPALITVIGIMTGEFVFILLAIHGLSAIATTTDGLFVFVAADQSGCRNVLTTQG